MHDSIEVRPGETLDTTRLEPYLRSELGETAEPFELRQFGGGHANLTYLVRFGEREYVLRRPPHGPLPKGGHDMQREYRVLSVLWEPYPLAPRAYLLCTDHDVIGADFVVVERRRGIVIRRSLPAQLSDEASRRRLSENFIDALAALHSVDYRRAKLEGLGRPDGYLDRHLSAWVERWRAAETPKQADARSLINRLIERRPESGPPALLHNDFKFDNTIVDADDPTRFVAVLDWDMCTVGDPLVDLGNVLAFWREPEDPPGIALIANPTGDSGFLSRTDLIARYALATGRDCSRAAWYRAYNLFRNAVIVQQIYARFVRGQTQDERFRQLDVDVSGLIGAGDALVTAGI